MTRLASTDTPARTYVGFKYKTKTKSEFKARSAVSTAPTLESKPLSFNLRKSLKHNLQCKTFTVKVSYMLQTGWLSPPIMITSSPFFHCCCEERIKCLLLKHILNPIVTYSI